jgi:hypothetical protein
MAGSSATAAGGPADGEHRSTRGRVFASHSRSARSGSDIFGAPRSRTTESLSRPAEIALLTATFETPRRFA